MWTYTAAPYSPGHTVNVYHSAGSILRPRENIVVHIFYIYLLYNDYILRIHYSIFQDCTLTEVLVYCLHQYVYVLPLYCIICLTVGHLNK